MRPDEMSLSRSAQRLPKFGALYTKDVEILPFLRAND
jgi:hypothetical protein